MVNPSSYHAVVTGDIVRSTRLSKEAFQAVQDAIVRAGEELARHFPGRLPYPVELFRGDSWQMFLPDPGDALRLGLFVRAFVRAEAGRVDTRIAIGVGSVDKMPERSVGDGRGDAFRISGELADVKGGSRMRFAIIHEPAAWWQERSISAVLTVLDGMVSRWTSAQGTAVCGALLGRKQEQIAEQWPRRPITQQSAGQHLARAGWDGVREAVEYYEDVMNARAAR